MDISSFSVCTRFYGMVANIDIFETAEEITKIGFKYLDIWIRKPHFDPEITNKKAIKIKNRLSNMGVGVASLASYPGINFLTERIKELDNLKRTAELAKILGAKSARVVPPKGENKDVLQKSKPLLEAAARIGEEFDIQFGIENHKGYFSINPELCRFACEIIKSRYLGILYDPANLASSGIDLKKTTELFLDYIVHVHLKDCYTSIDNKIVHAQIGEGIVDPAWVISILRRSGYNGYIALEYEIPVNNNRDTKNEITKNLKRWYLYIKHIQPDVI